MGRAWPGSGLLSPSVQMRELRPTEGLAWDRSVSEQSRSSAAGAISAATAAITVLAATGPQLLS